MVSGHLMICPKVSLADIFFVSRPIENINYYNKISRKHVDFLLCDPNTLRPRLAVELDDASHERPERDYFVEDVFDVTGLPLVRVPVRQTYNTQELAALFKKALQEEGSRPKGLTPIESISPDDPAPFCPKCGSQMVLRTAQRGNRAGQQFYGCPSYPKCREIIPFET